MKSAKIVEIVRNIYREQYRQSEPVGNFDELILGEDKDFFKKYFIDDKLFDEIIKTETKKYKLSKYEKELISRTIYLGVSPMFKL
jgi:hypothetical protein